MKDRLAVVGRGIAALAVAFWARKEGFSLDIFGPERGNGDASYAAHGFSIHKGLRIPESPFFRAKMIGQGLLWAWIKEIEKKTRSSIDSIQGLYEPYWGVEEFNKIYSRVYRKAFTGCYGVDHKKFNRYFDDSIFTQRPSGVIHYFNDFWFNPRQFLDLTELHLAKEGVSFLPVNVLNISRVDGHWEIQSDLKRFSNYSHVVLAAGAGTNGILERSGYSPFPVKLVLGEVLETKLNVNQRFAVTRFGSGAIFGEDTRIPIQKIDDSFDRRIQASLAYFSVQSQLLSHHSIVNGQRVRSRDKLPIVGKVDRKNDGLFVCFGLNRNGMELAPECARSIVMQIKNQKISGVDHISAFFPDRLKPVIH